jgi:hypothetical protein
MSSKKPRTSKKAAEQHSLSNVVQQVAGNETIRANDGATTAASHLLTTVEDNATSTAACCFPLKTSVAGTLLDVREDPSFTCGPVRIDATATHEEIIDPMEPNVRQSPPSTWGSVLATSNAIRNQPTDRDTRRHVLVKNLLPTTTSDWVLDARVIARSPVRHWENLRTQGTLQELFLADTSGAIIRGTLFNDAVDKFSDLTEPGSVCALSHGRVKFGFLGSNTRIRESELTFDETAIIQPITSDIHFATPSVYLTSLAGVANVPSKAAVNVIGILLHSAATKRIISANGKNSSKRELVLIDESNVKLFCTLWGNYARDDLADVEGEPVLIKGGQVSDYKNTRSVTAGMNATFMTKPQLPRARELSSWYATGVDYDSFQVVQSP